MMDPLALAAQMLALVPKQPWKAVGPLAASTLAALVVTLALLTLKGMVSQ
jgi:hypothetical protein